MSRSLALRALRSASKLKPKRKTKQRPRAVSWNRNSQASKTPPFKGGHYSGLLLDFHTFGDCSLSDSLFEFYVQYMEDLNTIYPNQIWDFVEIGETGEYIDRFRGFSIETLISHVKCHRSSNPTKWLIRISVLGDQYYSLRPEDLCDHNMYDLWLNKI